VVQAQEHAAIVVRPALPSCIDQEPFRRCAPNPGFSINQSA